MDTGLHLRVRCLPVFKENNTCFGRFFPAPARTGRGNSVRGEVARAERRAVVVRTTVGTRIAKATWLMVITQPRGCCSAQLSHHDRRNAAGPERADYLISANLGRTLQADVVSSLRKCVRRLPGYLDRCRDRRWNSGHEHRFVLRSLTSFTMSVCRWGVYNHV